MQRFHEKKTYRIYIKERDIRASKMYALTE